MDNLVTQGKVPRWEDDILRMGCHDSDVTSDACHQNFFGEQMTTDLGLKDRQKPTNRA